MLARLAPLLVALALGALACATARHDSIRMRAASIRVPALVLPTN